MQLSEYINTRIETETAAVVWADYTKLSPDRFGELESLVGKLHAPAVVKVTLPARPIERGASFASATADWKTRYQRWQITSCSDEDLSGERFKDRVYEMIQAAVQLPLPAVDQTQFQPLQALWYSEGTPMVSVTGVLCDGDDRDKIRDALASWDLRNTEWEPLRRVDVPILSAKERLELERWLPISGSGWISLKKALGYRLDGTEAASDRKYRQYKRFHQYYPLFGEVSF